MGTLSEVGDIRERCVFLHGSFSFQAGAERVIDGHKHEPTAKFTSTEVRFCSLSTVANFVRLAR